jgi:outer membrane protein OmpA-like peptidoglycan-associated protein
MSNSKYNFWTWLVAIVLAIYLFWQWQHGHGLGSAAGCCGATVAEVPAAPVAAPEAVAPEAFQFTADTEKFQSSGNAGSVAWYAKNVDLVSWLKAGGADWQASGNDHSVTLTGTVANEEAKTQAGKDAQAFFGENIAIDNQLVVKAADPVAAIAPPPAAKLYFDTGKTDLANDAEQTLAPIVEWLKANASAKAIISGYHDPRGNQAVNEDLAKNRAKAVRDALKAAGIDEARIELRKPVSTDGDGDLAEARRVEVSVE